MSVVEIIGGLILAAIMFWGHVRAIKANAPAQHPHEDEL